MNKHLRFPKLLAALLALIVPAALPAALAAGVQAVVSVESMNVYAPKSPYALLGALPKGTEVTVTAKSGDAVMISYNGNSGIARASELKQAETAAAAESGRAMVANRDSRVYSRASTESSYAGIAAGEAVTLLAVNGKCAKVKRDGKVGYMAASHLSEPGAAVQSQATAAAEPVTSVNAAAVTNRSARVYASAALSGESVGVSEGLSLTLLAVRGEVAMVERGGAIGFMELSALSKGGAAAEAAPKASNPFSSGSNEHAIYAWLTGEMGLNRAAAMGVMANIRYESSYNPQCSGDSGTSYGICQWHAGRKTNLISYCEEQGLDYTTLEGQLRFLKYELSGRYPSVLSYLKGVENTADGAYDAGYYFCFNFEAPAARTSQSTLRGNYAKDTLWNK